MGEDQSYISPEIDELVKEVVEDDDELEEDEDTNAED
jgi:hypothetical protein